MADANFKTLDGIFQAFTPVDLANKQQPNLGGPLAKIDDAFKALLGILENNGRGVLSADQIKERLLTLKTNSDPNVTNIDLSKYLTFFTTKEIVDLGPNTEKAATYIGKDGSKEFIKSVLEILGKDFVGALPKTNSPFDVSIIMSRSPFFNPATRNTKNAEIFLNSMPSTVLSQLVPLMQVEFQLVRNPAEQLQAVSQLKLLMGAVNKNSLQGANKAMVEGHQIKNSNGDELDFAGMELFTSPQTLTDPQPNQKVGSTGTRYTNVIDPFRPFATLEHVTITSVPSGAGFFCYKKANLTLKIHDRSRLAEISDLIRPRVYTGVTIWMTYGWRAPNHTNNNPYFAYINNNMLVREPYHIVNSSFSFDQVGQVTLNLELFTKGVAEMRELKISDNKLDMSFRSREIKDLIEKIAMYRQRLRLDPPEGLNKEVRVFQILEAASGGEFPDFDAKEVSKKIDSLQAALNHTANIDKEAVNGLITAMRDLYKQADDPKKYLFKERYKKMITSVIDNMFLEVQTGPDPFLPAAGKFAGDDIIKICDDLNKPAATKPDKFRKQAVSFGKMFSVFALRAIASIPDAVDEVQVFFYNLNDQCGPISGHSIAEFPIDMNQFIDQYRQEVISKGGEKITLENFLALCINAQFLDNRAIGYGLRAFYEPYTSGKDAAIKKDQEGEFESAQAAQSFKYGAFKKPVVEMYIETSHQRVSDAGDNDILQALNYSAKDVASVSINDVKSAAAKKIMRIHVYDKQTTVHKAASALLRNESDTGFLSMPEGVSSFTEKYNSEPKSIFDHINSAIGSAGAIIAGRSSQPQIVSPFVNNQQIKDVVSKLVPTIRYGANGTTINHANLTSKADPLLSTTQMIRSQTIKNRASPNGSGELGVPLRVIPAQMTMPTLGNPLATMAQQYFIDFQTGTTLDNLYIVTGLTHTFAPGKFETSWNFGYCDAYGVFEGAPNIIKELNKLSPTIVKDPSNV